MLLSILTENLGTIAVIAVIAVVALLIIFRLAKNRKEGKSSCGCGCSSCPMKGKCHAENPASQISENEPRKFDDGQAR